MIDVFSKEGVASHSLHLLERLRAGAILIKGVGVREMGDHVSNVAVQILLQLREFLVPQQLLHDHEAMLIVVLFLKFEGHSAFHSGDLAAGR